VGLSTVLSSSYDPNKAAGIQSHEADRVWRRSAGTSGGFSATALLWSCDTGCCSNHDAPHREENGSVVLLVQRQSSRPVVPGAARVWPDTRIDTGKEDVVALDPSEGGPSSRPGSGHFAGPKSRNVHNRPRRVVTTTCCFGWEIMP